MEDEAIENEINYRKEQAEDMSVSLVEELERWLEARRKENVKVGSSMIDKDTFCLVAIRKNYFKHDDK